jgi:hypothetical protein
LREEGVCGSRGRRLRQTIVSPVQKADTLAWPARACPRRRRVDAGLLEGIEGDASRLCFAPRRDVGAALLLAKAAVQNADALQPLA